MAYVKIHCGNCGKTWEIYETSDWKSYSARVCPHCYAEMDKDCYDFLLEAFHNTAEGNRELYKEATGYGKPCFRFDVLSDPIGRRVTQRGKRKKY